MTTLYAVSLAVADTNDEGYFFVKEFYPKLFSSKKEAEEFAFDESKKELSSTINQLTRDENESIEDYLDYDSLEVNKFTYDFDRYKNLIIYDENKNKITLNYVLDNTNAFNIYIKTLFHVWELEVPEHKHYKWDDIR